MKSIAVMKQRSLGAIAAVMLAVTALSVLPAGGALAYDAKIRIFKSADGKVTLICHYNEHNSLLYCDVATSR